MVELGLITVYLLKGKRPGNGVVCGMFNVAVENRIRLSYLSTALHDQG